jgi:hypothetical protein
MDAVELATEALESFMSKLDGAWRTYETELHPRLCAEVDAVSAIETDTPLDVPIDLSEVQCTFERIQRLRRKVASGIEARSMLTFGALSEVGSVTIDLMNRLRVAREAVMMGDA